MRWRDSFAIGVAAIDAQHRRLFEKVDQLDADVRAGDRAATAGTLAFLRDYALEHFEAEERLMRDVRYPRYPEHKAQHDAFVSRLLALAHEHDEGGASALLELRLQNWIGGWLELHVTEEDQLLGRHAAPR